MKRLSDPLPLKLQDRFDNDTVDSAKGVLILLVILGHASNFWTPEPFPTFSIKFFHVACFLLLPFIYDVRCLSVQYVKDRIARYYVPFAVFVLGYGTLYLFTFHGAENIARWLFNLVQALLIGNAPMLDDATGLRALWFMPALITSVLLCAYFIGTTKTPAWALLVGGFFVHISIGLVDAPYKFYLPLGIPIAAYLIWLGLVIRFICANVSKNTLKILSPVFLLVGLIGIFMSGYFDTLIKFPVMALPHIFDLKALFIHDLIIVSMFLFLITTPLFRPFHSLKWCGKNSLSLYLTHLLFMAVCMHTTTQILNVRVVNFENIAAVFFIFMTSLLGGVLCAMTINNWTVLKALIMPRTWGEWTPIRRLRK